MKKVETKKEDDEKVSQWSKRPDDDFEDGELDDFEEGELDALKRPYDDDDFEDGGLDDFEEGELDALKRPYDDDVLNWWWYLSSFVTELSSFVNELSSFVNEMSGVMTCSKIYSLSVT